MRLLFRMGVSAIILTAGLYFITFPKNTAALSASDFMAGNIMSDMVMTNDSSLSVSQIQTFLNGKVPTCDTQGLQTSEFGGRDINGDGRVQRYEWAADRGYSPPFTCLKAYSENGKLAAQIIYDAAQEFDINPQVLIVLLQKEQALVTDTWPIPGSSQYRTATGYGCPDTAPCDSQYYGLTNQLRWSARMFRAILNNSPTWFTPYLTGTNYIQYNPNASCGGSNVNIQNRTTQALYNYTPYQPNSAVLNWKFNGGAFPSSCGAYGNLNFFVYFNEWFGSTQGVNIIPVVFTDTTDTSGKTATVGFRLSARPTSDVVIPVSVSSVSNARVSAASVRISPENWGVASRNTVTVTGLSNDDLAGTTQYFLRTLKPSSADIRYASLSAALTPDAPLLHQSTNEPRSVFRLYDETLLKHHFTASAVERRSLITAGFRDEGSTFGYCTAGDQTVYRLYNEDTDTYRLAIRGTDTFSTLVSEGYVLDTIGFTASSQGSINVYLRYNGTTNNYLYTTSPTEGLSSGFVDLGVAFKTCESGVEPVYRLYNPELNNHLFTASTGERERAISVHGYTYEAVGYYLCENGTQEVYRLYRKSTNSHLYTVSASERDSAVTRHGFVYEGVAFTNL